jgi:hypothetical protein
MNIEGNRWYLCPALEKVIEAGVTNDLGFSLLREKNPWKDESCTFTYIDCRGISYEEAIKVNPNDTHLPKIETISGDVMNLHARLARLNYTHVLGLYNEQERKMPVLISMPVTEIEMPASAQSPFGPI